MKQICFEFSGHSLLRFGSTNIPSCEGCHTFATRTAAPRDSDPGLPPNRLGPAGRAAGPPSPGRARRPHNLFFYGRDWKPRRGFLPCWADWSAIKMAVWSVSFDCQLGFGTKRHTFDFSQAFIAAFSRGPPKVKCQFGVIWAPDGRTTWPDGRTLCAAIAPCRAGAPVFRRSVGANRCGVAGDRNRLVSSPRRSPAPLPHGQDMQSRLRAATGPPSTAKGYRCKPMIHRFACG